MKRWFDCEGIWSRNSRSRATNTRRRARGAARRLGSFAGPLGAFERLEDRELLAIDSGAFGGAMAPAAVVQNEFAQLPLSFEANQGQINSQVDFLARGPGYALYLTGSGAVLDLQQATAAPNSGSDPTAGSSNGEVSGTVIRMQFVGANPGATVTGLDKQQTVSNYFVGSDSNQWRTGIANFGQVEYQNLYSGVNAVFHGNQGRLEYDFIVAPGADPNQIQLQIEGANGLSLDSDGNLLIHTAGGDLVEEAPNIYQEIGGQRVAIVGHFVLEGADRVGFAIGSYDASASLVIDPTLSYSTYLGGSGGITQGQAITADSSGNAYVTGVTSSMNFPTTPGAYQTTLAGATDAFVTKFSADGKSLVYSTYLGGSSADGGAGIVVDGGGNVYLSGDTSSSDFPTTPGAYQTAYGGNGDVFVTELSASGGSLVYSTYLGGVGLDDSASIAVDGAGIAYLTGYTGSSDFPTTPSAFQTATGGSFDAFVTKLNSTGASLVYSTYLGGSGDDRGFSIAADSAGNAHVAGFTASGNFPTTPGAFQTAFGGGTDAFVTELNSSGSSLVYSTYLGGSGNDAGYGIAIDGAGDAYVTGLTLSTNFPVTPGAFQTSLLGTEDAIVTKLNPAGSSLVYSTYLGGNGVDEGYSIAVDSAGDAFVTGFTGSTNFPTTPGAFQTSFGGNLDAFMTKLNALGNNPIYSTYLGGSGADNGRSIAVDSAGNAYLAGLTLSSNFPVSADAYQTTLAGSQDAYVAKFLTAATHNQQFIGQLYHDLLGREVDAGGLNYWDAQLAAGLPRSQVALAIQQTLEYAQRTVSSLYSRYLHRAADAGGLNFFSQLLLQGATVEQIAAALAGSDEFFLVQGGGTNDGFLNALYQDALGRPIDSGGLAWWSAQLAAGISRTQVAAQILASVEYRQGVVQAAYQLLLGRAADSGGLSYWTNALNAGATDQQLNAAIAGSDEYYARAA